MSKAKKSRKAKAIYILQDAYGKDVNIDLNNYRVICNKTGKRKSFYHKYLYNLIMRKYEGNIDRFRVEYVSREAHDPTAAKVKAIQARIDRLTSQLNDLIWKRDELTTSNS